MLQDNLIGAALRFRDTELWKRLRESQLFVVKLPDGEMVYCAVMGNKGEYLALGMYKGAEGLSSYFNSLRMSRESAIDIMSTKMLFNHINCTFENASMLHFPEYKAEIQAYAKANGLKIRRSRGYPEFLCMRPCKMDTPISDPEEQAWATETLDAATTLALRMKTEDPIAMGFAKPGSYPPEKGGRKIPMLERQADGSFLFSQFVMPASSAPSFPTVPFEDEQIARKFKSIKKHPNFAVQCRAISIEVAEMAEENRFGILLLSSCEDQDGVALKPVIGQRFPNNSSDMLTEFGEYLIETVDCLPVAIEVNDELTASIMKDFCEKCGIKLRVIDDERRMRSLMEQVYIYLMGIGYRIGF